MIFWLSNEVSACRDLAVVRLTRGPCRSFESGVLAAVPTDRQEDPTMDVMIGVDPHKGSHTATMLDRAERELPRIKVRTGCRQVAELLEWANGQAPRT
jgi:hypothetical protein